MGVLMGLTFITVRIWGQCLMALGSLTGISLGPGTHLTSVLVLCRFAIFCTCHCCLLLLTWEVIFFFFSWPCHSGPVYQSLPCTWPWLSSLGPSCTLNSGLDLGLTSLPWALLMIWALMGPGCPPFTCSEVPSGKVSGPFLQVTSDFHEHPWYFTVLTQVGVSEAFIMRYKAK